MLPKSAFALTAAAILADKVVAFNAHRIDASPERGAVYGNTKVEVVTDWVTITVTEDPPAITHLASSTSSSAYPTPPTTPTTLLPQPKPSPAGVAHAENVDSDANVGKPSPSAPGQPTPAPAPPAAAPVAPSPVRAEALVHTTPIVTPQVASPSPLPAPPPPPPPPSPAPLPSPSSVEVASVAAATQSPVGTVSTASTPSTGKRGLAYNNPVLLDLFFAGSDKCTWGYNWDSTPGLLTHNIEFVPMLWGTNSDHTTAWMANAEAAIASGSTAVLSFNEPDNAGQANLSPAAAAAAHVQWVNPLAGKARIGSPAITNSQIPGQGTDWLQSFMNECKTQNCAIDFCVTHWYDLTTASDALYAHLEKVHTICDGKPVWLTEFAPVQADDSAIAAFLPGVLDGLDALDYMERYAYFHVGIDSLLASPLALSKYGSIYSSH